MSQTFTQAVSDGVASNTIENDAHDAHEERGKNKCIRYPFTKLWGFVTHTIWKVSPSHSPPTSTFTQSSGMSKPIAHFINCYH